MVEDIKQLERKIEVAKKQLQILITALHTNKAKLRKFDQTHNLNGSGKWAHAMQCIGANGLVENGGGSMVHGDLCPIAAKFIEGKDSELMISYRVCQGH